LPLQNRTHPSALSLSFLPVPPTRSCRAPCLSLQSPSTRAAAQTLLVLLLRATAKGPACGVLLLCAAAQGTRRGAPAPPRHRTGSARTPPCRLHGPQNRPRRPAPPLRRTGGARGARTSSHELVGKPLILGMDCPRCPAPPSPYKSREGAGRGDGGRRPNLLGLAAAAARDDCSQRPAPPPSHGREKEQASTEGGRRPNLLELTAAIVTA
jgi:hypothetical protein